MLPGNGLGNTDKTCYPGSPEYKFKYGSEGLNTNEIKEYIRNPHKFNTKPEMDGVYYNLWSTDNDKTDANDDVVIKSVYDPSPVGYSLPASNAFTGFTTTGQTEGSWPNPLTTEDKAKLNIKGDFDKGWYFYTKLNKSGKTFFFQASGVRQYDSGKLNWTNNSGCYWLSIPYITEQARPLFFNLNRIVPMGSNYRNFAMTVRSAEEKKGL